MVLACRFFPPATEKAPIMSIQAWSARENPLASTSATWLIIGCAVFNISIAPAGLPPNATQKAYLWAIMQYVSTCSFLTLSNISHATLRLEMASLLLPFMNIMSPWSAKAKASWNLLPDSKALDWRPSIKFSARSKFSISSAILTALS